MAKGRRRKKRLISTWWWGLVALLILWGGYQVWRVRQQIIGQMHRHQQRAEKTSGVDGTAQTTSPASIGVGVTQAGQETAPSPRSTLSSLQIRRVHQLVKHAIALADGGHLIAARNNFELAWRIAHGHQLRESRLIRKWLMEINTHTLLAGVAHPHDRWVRLIQVPPGADLGRIAHLYRITTEMLLSMNPIIQPRDVKAGSWLLVILGPFNVRINLSRQRMDILLHHQFVLDYPFDVSGALTPSPGDYTLVSASRTAISKGMPELISVTFAGETNGKRKTVRISNVSSPNTDLVMSTRALAELVKMLSPTFSVITIRS